MNPFSFTPGGLLATYWKPLTLLVIVLIIAGYIGLLGHKINALQRDDVSLQQTIDLAKAVGQAANEKAAKMEQDAKTASIAVTTQYQSDLKKVQAYNAAHPVVKRVIVNGVCNAPTDTSHSQVPPAPASPSRTDASPTDEVPSGQDIESECRITTLMLLRLQDFERGQQAIQ